MRGKAVKLCKKFARSSWDATPEAERPKVYKNYVKNIKRQFSADPAFKEFIKKFANSYK